MWDQGWSEGGPESDQTTWTWCLLRRTLEGFHDHTKVLLKHGTCLWILRSFYFHRTGLQVWCQLWELEHIWVPLSKVRNTNLDNAWKHVSVDGGENVQTCIWFCWFVFCISIILVLWYWKRLFCLWKTSFNLNETFTAVFAPGAWWSPCGEALVQLEFLYRWHLLHMVSADPH